MRRALLVRLAERPHESRRIVARRGGRDDVDRGAQRVQALPAGREERLVRRRARRPGPELRRVHLVPDRDVPERDPHEDVVEEVAVRASARRVERRVRRPAEHRDHDALAALDHHRGAVEIHANVVGRLCPRRHGIVIRTASSPRSRYFAMSPSGRESHFEWSSSTPMTNGAVGEGRRFGRSTPAELAAAQRTTSNRQTPSRSSAPLPNASRTGLSERLKVTAACALLEAVVRTRTTGAD